MSGSVLVNVDESTKALMEEIQSGLSDAIEEGLSDLKEVVESIDENTSTTLQKFESLGNINSSVQKLTELAQKMTQLSDSVTPIKESISEIEKRAINYEQAREQEVTKIELIIQRIKEQDEKQKALSVEFKEAIQNATSQHLKKSDELKELLSQIAAKLDKEGAKQQENYTNLCSLLNEQKQMNTRFAESITECCTNIQSGIHNLEASQKSFLDIYISRESAHEEFEKNTRSQLQNMGDSLNNIQKTLDIVVDYVTPFWKKWFKS